MTLGNDNGTDGQTDRVRRNMRPPPREDGRIITKNRVLKISAYAKMVRLNNSCLVFCFVRVYERSSVDPPFSSLV